MSGSGFLTRRNQLFLGDAGGIYTAGDQASWLVGGLGVDRLFGGIGHDSLFGAAGDDLLDGVGGFDRLVGGSGLDTLRGGLGDDTLSGQDGDDLLEGGDGADHVLGGFGNDFVWGGAGNDTVQGDEGDDTIRSGDGEDLLIGGFGNDVLCAAAGNDVMLGAEGNDILWGGDGNDHGKGGYGNDLLTGGNGDDTLLGCGGEDFLLSRSDAGEPDIAGSPGTPRVFPGLAMSGNDLLDGGPDADVFRFELLVNARPEIVQKWTRADGTVDWAGISTENGAAHDHWVDGIGNDTIVGFSKGSGDRIEIFGHDIEIASIGHVDTDGNGLLDSVINLRGMAGGAHGGDALGSITVLDRWMTRAEIAVRSDMVIGAFETLAFGQFPGDRFGTLPAGFTGLEDWAM